MFASSKQLPLISLLLFTDLYIILKCRNILKASLFYRISLHVLKTLTHFWTQICPNSIYLRYTFFFTIQKQLLHIICALTLNQQVMIDSGEEKLNKIDLRRKKDLQEEQDRVSVRMIIVNQSINQYKIMQQVLVIATPWKTPAESYCGSMNLR